MEQRLRNLDRRVEGIEQILPTLATRDDLKAAIGKAAEPLEPRAELQGAKVELRTAIDESEQRMRTHFDVVAESLRNDVQLIATARAKLSQHGQ